MLPSLCYICLKASKSYREVHLKDGLTEIGHSQINLYDLANLAEKS